MKVAAEADLIELDFVGTEDLGRSADGVIFRMIEAAPKIGIESDFRGEEFRIPNRIFVTRVTVQPSPVRIRKRRREATKLLGFGG